MEHAPKQFRKRNAILAGLRQSKAHPSAEELFTALKSQIPDLSMGTVYRNLNLFKEQGLAVSVATVKGVERFDGITDPHVHFICSNCDEVIDLHQIQVPQELTASVETTSGCRPDGCQLTFTGLCQKCRQIREKIS